MTARATSITLEKVGKRFGDVQAVHPTDLKIARSEFLTLLGPSGCGKTTLLRMIAGLESVSTGKILIDDVDVTTLPPRRRDVAIMFQDYALFPHMSVLDNVGYGLKMQGQSPVDRKRAAQSWLDRFELGPQSGRKPDALSGGQRQRAALARALITQPGALLLDEPLSALDANLRTQLRRELRRIHRDMGTTFVCVTHDQEEAMTMSDRIAVLNAGRIEQIDSPDALYDSPVSAFVAQFFGRCTLWPATIVDRAAGMARVAGGMTLPYTGTPQGDQVLLVVRPESLALCTKGDPDLSATVSDVMPKGPVAEVSLRLDDESQAMLDVPRLGGMVPAQGARVGLDLAAQALAAVPDEA